MAAFFTKKPLILTIVLGVVLAIALILFFIITTERVVERKIFRIARDVSWYPLELLGKEKHMVGFTSELIQKIAKEQDFHYELVRVGPNVLLEGLDRGNYEAALSSLTPSVVTKKKFVFSDPIYLLGPVLIVSEDSELKSLEGMEDKILGIQTGASQVFNIPDYPHLLIIPYDNMIVALEDLDKDVIDGVILDAMVAHAYTKGFYKGRLKVVTSPLTEKGLRLVTRKEPRSLLLISRFNAGLKTLRNDGTYEKLLEKWNLINVQDLQPENRREN